MRFLFGEGEGFHNIFGDGQTKWPIATKEKKSPIQKFVLWDAPQQIKLVSKNHYKYLSSYKNSDQKWR